MVGGRIAGRGLISVRDTEKFVHRTVGGGNTGFWERGSQKLRE